MMKNKMIGDVSGSTLGILIDLLSKLRQGSITVEEVLKAARKKRFVGDPLEGAPESVLAALGSLIIKHQRGAISLEQLEDLVKKERYCQTTEEIKELQMEWIGFYWHAFGSHLIFDAHEILAPLPPYQSGFGWLALIHRKLSLEMAVEACRDEFPVEFELLHLMGNFTHCRSNMSFANPAYYIGIRNRQEADKRLLGLSADRIWEQNIEGINLIEMLMLQLKYFLENKQHLNLKTRTLCTGSWLNKSGGKQTDASARGGLVPSVHCSKGRVYIGLVDQTFKAKEYGTRQIVV